MLRVIVATFLAMAWLFTLVFLLGATVVAGRQARTIGILQDQNQRLNAAAARSTASVALFDIEKEEAA